MSILCIFVYFPIVNMFFMHIFVVSCRNLYKTGKNCYIKI